MTPPVPVGRGQALTRVVPTVCFLAVVFTAVLIVSPTVRRQLDLSTSRQPEPYVDLYFADVVAARTCPTSNGMTRLAVKLVSHLAQNTAVRYVVSVRADAAASRSGHRRVGTVQTNPGRVSTIRADVAVPHRAYAVEVRLPDRPERLLLHCDGIGPTR